jgi:hypothetical protein
MRGGIDLIEKYGIQDNMTSMGSLDKREKVACLHSGLIRDSIKRSLSCESNDLSY